jgi:hypothetical protein
MIQKRIRTYLRAFVIFSSVSSSGVSFILADSYSKATRVVSHPKTPNSPYLVSIKIKPQSTVKAFAVEETPPSNCQASEIDNDGNLNQSQHVIKWGIFFNSNPKTLSYKLVCSEFKNKKNEFKGQASFDGSSIEIGGARRID